MTTTQAEAWDTVTTRILGCSLPIVLAPMGGVSGGRLAAAVSAAGGLGILGAGYADTAWIDAAFGEAGNARVGIGFITWHLARHPERLEAALAHAPAAVMLSFGDPAAFLGRIKDAGAVAIVQVQSLAQAERAAALGADLIVAQGSEAGGHGAGRGTFALVPAVADAVAPVPVLAAGGVADGRGLAAAFMLGASGAVVGTRLYATREALGHGAIKQRLAEARGDDTVRTRVFDIVRELEWPEGYTGRAVRNRFVEHWEGREAELRESAEARTAFHAAVAAGDGDDGLVWASEAIDLVHAVEPAGDVVRTMARQAAALLSRPAAGVPAP